MGKRRHPKASKKFEESRTGKPGGFLSFRALPTCYPFDFHSVTL